MNAEQIIPPITDPRGKNWQQPHRWFIGVDDKSALMLEQTFKGLKECITMFPRPIYVGKMWKKNVAGTWFLCWVTRLPNLSYAIEKREILM